VRGIAYRIPCVRTDRELRDDADAVALRPSRTRLVHEVSTATGAEVPHDSVVHPMTGMTARRLRGASGDAGSAGGPVAGGRSAHPVHAVGGRRASYLGPA